MNVAVLPGIFAGKHTTRRLRMLLGQAGYTVVRNAAKADIVIAHSGGCLWLPKPNQKQLIILIGTPYWPGKSVQQRAMTFARNNTIFSRHGTLLLNYLRLNLWIAYYTFAALRRNQFIIRNIPDFDLEQAVRGRRAVLIRNELDEWMSPDLDKVQQANPNLKIIRLPGVHNDFNYYPERYVDLLQSLV